MSVQEDSSLIILGSSPACLARGTAPIRDEVHRPDPEILHIISDDEDKIVQPHIIDLSDPLPMLPAEAVSSSPVVLVRESSLSRDNSQTKLAEQQLNRAKTTSKHCTERTSQAAAKNASCKCLMLADQPQTDSSSTDCTSNPADIHSQVLESLLLPIMSSYSSPEMETQGSLLRPSIPSGSEDGIDDVGDLEWLISSRPRCSTAQKTSSHSPKGTIRSNRKRKLSAQHAEAEYSKSSSKSKKRENELPFPINLPEEPTRLPVPGKKKSDKNKKGNKQALIHANRLRTRKDCSKEMILDVHSTILTDDFRNLLEQSLSTYGIEICTKEESTDKTFTWRRKLACRYDPQADQYFPTEVHITNEDVALVYMKAEEFVLICCGGNLEEYMSKTLENKLHHGKLLFIIEGLKCYMRKVSRAKQKDFQDKVCDLMDTSSGSSTGHRKKKSRKIGNVDVDGLDPDVIDLALIDLQVTYDCLVHFTENVQETCQWICEFTQDLSVLNYRRTRASHNSSFNGETISMKSYDSTSEATNNALQHIRMVTFPVASSIVNYYNSFGSLISNLIDRGPDALLRPHTNGSRHGKIQVGSKLARDINFILTCKDANSFV